MASEHEEIEETEEPELEEEVEEDADSIRRMIRDEIEAVLSKIPGEGSVTDIKKDLPADDEEPLTLRAVEAAVRRQVEEAMKPLRAAQKKPATTKKKPAPKVEKEPETEPVVKDLKSRIQRIMWGAE